MSLLPVGKRPMLIRGDMDRFIRHARMPEEDRVSPDGSLHFLCVATMNTPPGEPRHLFFRTVEKRGKAPMTVGLAERCDTPHGPLRHITVSYPNHYPTWGELTRCRTTFFDPGVAVMQVLPEQETPYINDHPFCLWLWEMPEKWGWPDEDPDTTLAALGVTIERGAP